MVLGVMVGIPLGRKKDPRYGHDGRGQGGENYATDIRDIADTWPDVRGVLHGDLRDSIRNLLCVSAATLGAIPVHGYLPVAWLHPDAQAFQFLGRDREVKELVDWCLTGEQFSAAVIHASGGTGKSRLAAEVCRELAIRHRCVAGPLDPGSLADGRFARAAEVAADLGRPVLLTVDYAEGQEAEVLTDLLEALPTQARQYPVRWRVLAVGRDGDRLEATVARYTGRGIAAGPAIALPPLTGDIRADKAYAKLVGNLLEAARQYGATITGACAPLPPSWLMDNANAVDLTLAAFLAVDGKLRGESLPEVPDQLAAVRYLIGRERHLMTCGPLPAGWDESDLLDALAALTLLDTADEGVAEAVLAAIGEARGRGHAGARAARIALWQRYPATSGGAARVLRPDPVGEILVADRQKNAKRGGIDLLAVIYESCPVDRRSWMRDALRRVVASSPDLAPDVDSLLSGTQAVRRITAWLNQRRGILRAAIHGATVAETAVSHAAMHSQRSQVDHSWSQGTSTIQDADTGHAPAGPSYFR